MDKTISISQEVYERLGKYMQGFDDTPQDVIVRLLDKIENQIENNSSETFTKYSESIKAATRNSGHNFSRIDYHTTKLPIELDPNNEQEFKEQLLNSKLAYIEVHYNDCRTKTKPWKAYNFSERSGVMRNLRSRPEFRQGAWQRAGIKRVHVYIKKSEDYFGLKKPI